MFGERGRQRGKKPSKDKQDFKAIALKTSKRRVITHPCPAQQDVCLSQGKATCEQLQRDQGLDEELQGIREKELGGVSGPTSHSQQVWHQPYVSFPT